MIFIDAIARWWRNWNTARATLANLDYCGAEETKRMASDLGMTPPELRALAGKWPDGADRLNHRLAALHLDRAEIRRTEPMVLADMQRVCTMCTDQRKCDHDLPAIRTIPFGGSIARMS
jgi:hypothetical protein